MDIFFSIFFNMKVYYLFTLELPHRGGSNEYIRHTIIDIKKKITQIFPKYKYVCSYRIFSKGLKNGFEIAVVNEPSVFFSAQGPQIRIRIVHRSRVQYKFLFRQI